MMDKSVSMSSPAGEITDLKAFRGQLPDALILLEQSYSDHRKQGEDHRLISDGAMPGSA
jgi:hypothetical protein